MAKALSTLTFVAAEQPKSHSAVDPTERRRAALVARIEEQITLVNAQLEGKPPAFTRTVKNKETGQKETKPKSVRPWHWTANGKVMLVVRYGLHVLKLSPKGNAIEAPSLKALVSVLQTVKSAVQNGELDAAISAATPKREKSAAK